MLTQSGAPVSHTSAQYIDFVEIFNISLDLSAIYFAHFSSVGHPLCVLNTMGLCTK